MRHGEILVLVVTVLALECKSVKFPVGLGAKGNEGVAGQIKTSVGSVGYVELAYAKQTGLSYAAIENRASNYVQPTLESIVVAATSTDTMLPDDLRISVVDSAGARAYPIAAFTYVLLYQDQKDASKGKALARFLRAHCLLSTVPWRRPCWRLS